MLIIAFVLTASLLGWVYFSMLKSLEPLKSLRADMHSFASGNMEAVCRAKPLVEGADEIAETTASGAALGYTPQGMETGFSFDALFPDYAIEGLTDVTGYILSAVLGAALLIITFKVLASFKKKETNYDVPAEN